MNDCKKSIKEVEKALGKKLHSLPKSKKEMKEIKQTISFLDGLDSAPFEVQVAYYTLVTKELIKTIKKMEVFK